MSKTSQPMTLVEAQSFGSEFVALIGEKCEKVSIAGSTRRNKPMVNDIEIVAQPKDAGLWLLLDNMVVKGIIQKAMYGDVGQTTRWGAKYRGLVYKGRRIEIFCGDEHNYGYQLWLRTGPDNQADRANTFVVTQIKYRAPISLVEGRVMYGSRQVSVPDEHVWFALLGLDFIHPQKRGELAYRELANPKHQWGDPLPYLVSDMQPKLF